MEGKPIMKNEHEQLYVAVQDLLIELGITPEDLKDTAARKTHGYHTKPTITAQTAQKLIDADLIVEEINWRKPEDGDHASVITNFPLSKFDKALLTFDEIKSNLPQQTLWLYLREKHPEFLLERVKDYLFPSD